MNCLYKIKHIILPITKNEMVQLSQNILQTTLSLTAKINEWHHNDLFIILSLEWRYALKVVASLPLCSSVYVNYVISCKRQAKRDQKPVELIQDMAACSLVSGLGEEKKDTRLAVIENQFQNK